MCLCVAIIVAIKVIMIVKWHWWLHIQWPNNIDPCVGRHVWHMLLHDKVMQISSSTKFVPEVLCTFRHQLYRERDVTAAFLPPQGQPLAQGLIVVMNLFTNVASILWHFGHSQDWWQLMSTRFVT
jgi:hypothetical protein